VINSKKMKWAKYVARVGEERGIYRILVGRPEGKRPLGRPKSSIKWTLGRQKSMG
jgi:hypothetical protein